MTKSGNLTSYALAIFQMAPDRKTMQKYYDQILWLDVCNSKHPNFSRVLSARNIDKKDRRELLGQTLRFVKIDPTIIYWTWTIIDNNQWGSFHLIARECRKLHHLIFDISRVNVVTAFELDKSQLNKLNTFFTKKLNSKIDLNVTVDPNLIGGLKIAINNRTYNNTVINKLDNLKRELLSKKGE